MRGVLLAFVLAQLADATTFTLFVVDSRIRYEANPFVSSIVTNFGVAPALLIKLLAILWGLYAGVVVARAGAWRWLVIAILALGTALGVVGAWSNVA